MEKIPIYRMNLLVIDEDTKKNFSALVKFEKDRVMSGKTRGIRIVDFPSGEKYIIFMALDFLDYCPNELAGNIIGWHFYCNGKVYTVILHTHVSSDKDKIHHHFKLLQDAIMQTGTKKIIPNFDPEIYELVEGRT